MKRLIIGLLILLFAFPAYAQVKGVSGKGITAKGVGAVATLTCNTATPAIVCNANVTLCYASGFKGVYENIGEKIKNSSSIQICQIDVYIYTTTGTARAAHFEVWDTNDRSGTQYGGNSATVSVDNASAAWRTFSWSSNYPNPTGDFWSILLEPAASGNLVWGYTSTNTTYEDTNYDVWRSGTDANQDVAFKIFTLQ